MASNKRSLIVDIVADAKGMKKATQEAESGLAAFESKIGKIGSSLAGVFAGGALLSFGRQAAEAALEDQRAQERLAKTLQNVTGATRDQVRAVEDFISKTESQFAVIDDELRPAFETLVRATKDTTEAQKLMQLALDVSAGSGKSLQEVSLALVKAHGGNMRALKDLGITVKDTEGKTLSFNDVVAQLSATFSGQAALAADSQSGQLRKMQIQYENLKESIGRALLPVMIQLADIANALFGWFNRLDSGTQKFIVTVVATGAAAFTAVKAFVAIREAIALMNISMSTSPIGAFAAAVAVLGGAFLMSRDSGNDATETADNYAKAVKQLGFDAESTTALLRAFNQETHNGNVPDEKSIHTFAAALKSLGLNAHDAGLLMKWFTTPGMEMGDIFDQLSPKAQEAARSFVYFAQYAADMPAAVEHGTRVLEEQATAVDTARMSVDEYNRRLNEQVGFQHRAEEAVKRTTQAILDAADQVRSKFDAKFAADKAALEAQKGLKELGKELKGLTKGSLEYNVVVEEQADKTLTAADAAGELAKKQSGLTGAAGEAVKNRAMLDYLKDLAFKLDPKNPLQRYLAEWIVQLYSVPTDVNTNITLNWKDNVPKWARKYALHFTPEAAANEAAGVDGVKAAGGPVMGGRRYLVGERGPELFVPGQSGTIIPNHALGGGAVFNVSVNAGMGANGQDIGNAIVSALKSWVRSNGKIAGIAA